MAIRTPCPVVTRTAVNVRDSDPVFAGDHNNDEFSISVGVPFNAVYLTGDVEWFETWLHAVAEIVEDKRQQSRPGPHGAGPCAICDAREATR